MSHILSGPLRCGRGARVVRPVAWGRRGGSRTRVVGPTQPGGKPAQIHVQAAEEDDGGHDAQLYVPPGDAPHPLRLWGHSPWLCPGHGVVAGAGPESWIFPGRIPAEPYNSGTVTKA
ncbi:hypothetical protein GCM10010156_47330 [Planobispora rosea]|uniref:Uncharacterized protein n=1 Tax=Planobispora rosea TaxID=35762 RepID=A0A8J3WCT2_PLARO|nr:hypothetical protein GCM10010156_47330 [Planobispora rosea]GIH84152.1 hypothetical protein Pro02_25600 [Planobispora rosea]